jgi:integrase
MRAIMASIEKRVGQTGDITYRAKVRLKGYPSQSATFNRLTDAKKWIQDTEANIRHGRHFKTAEAKKHTLSETIDRYFRDVLAHKGGKTVNQEHYLKWWKSQIGAYRLSDITPALLVEQKQLLIGSENRYGRKIGPTTSNRYIQALGHVFTVAMNEWEWTEVNPIRKVSKHKESRGRVRYLTDEERKALLEACQASDNHFLYPVVILALSTGSRKMEVMNLKWQDIDFDRQQIVLHETKNGERRVVPLQGLALDLLKQHSKVRILHCDYIFPSQKITKDKAGKIIYQPVDIRRAWENAVERANLQDFRFHDLRHTAASYLAMNGASPVDIAAVLGHKTLQMVKRYAHLSEAHTSEIVRRMNEKMFS